MYHYRERDILLGALIVLKWMRARGTREKSSRVGLQISEAQGDLCDTRDWMNEKEGVCERERGDVQ